MNQHYQKKLAEQRNKLFSPLGIQKAFKASSRENQLIADSGHLVHKIKAKDSTGRWAYYFVLVSAAMEKIFLRDLKSNQMLDLENYGKVLASNYGEKPSQDVLTILKDRYGWNVAADNRESK